MRVTLPGWIAVGFYPDKSYWGYCFDFYKSYEKTHSGETVDRIFNIVKRNR